MTRIITVLFFAVMVLVGIAPAAPPAAARLTLHPDRPYVSVNPLFFGVNTLYMYDTKATLADPALAGLLRDVPVRLIRFPGGDVADNYFWERHRLDDPKWWPRVDSPDGADTDSFMAFCRKVGAEPIFVVNLESGFVHGDIEAAVKRAADWVDYCNRKHDYRVKYWEIGNETYWYTPGKHKRVRVTAAEYGEAFARFAAAMKAVDPSIWTGAVGPVDHTSSANNILPDGSEASPRQPAWWPTVLAAAGPHVDFVSVHAYPGGANQTYETFVRRGVWGGETIPALREFLDRSLGRRVPVALTEWNVSEKTPLKGMALAQAQAGLLCRFLSYGVDMACAWPLRLPRANTRGLLDLRTLEPKPFYHVLALLSAALPGNTIIPSESEDSALFHFATLSADKSVATLVLIPKSDAAESRQVALDLPAEVATGRALVAPSLESTEVRLVDLACRRGADGGWVCDLPPYSICLLKLSGVGPGR